MSNIFNNRKRRQLCKKVFTTVFIIQLVCFGYLLWWYYFSPYYGYIDKTPWLAPFLASIFLTVGFLVVLIRSFFVKNKMFLLLLLPALWIAVFLDIFKGPVEFYYWRVDMSVDERLRLYENGTYDLLETAQTFANYSEGYYTCRNDTVLLSGDGEWNYDTTKRTLAVGNTIFIRGCCPLQAKVKKENKEYWKRLWWKWLWLR